MWKKNEVNVCVTAEWLITEMTKIKICLKEQKLLF